MINWQHKHFSALTRDELYAILKLRSEIFIVEQKDVYLDPDGKDQDAWHFLGWDEAIQLIAYGRVYLMDEKTISFGRFCVAKSARKKGYDKILLNKMMEWMQASEFNHLRLRIGAQAGLKKYYEQQGFVVVSEPYYDGSILHIWMERGIDYV